MRPPSRASRLLGALCLSVDPEYTTERAGSNADTDRPTRAHTHRPAPFPSAHARARTHSLCACPRARAHSHTLKASPTRPLARSPLPHGLLRTARICRREGASSRTANSTATPSTSTPPPVTRAPTRRVRPGRPRAAGRPASSWSASRHEPNRARRTGQNGRAMRAGDPGPKPESSRRRRGGVCTVAPAGRASGGCPGPSVRPYRLQLAQ